MTDRKSNRQDERFKIEGDPEDALRALLGTETPMTAADMARNHGIDEYELRELIREHHDYLMPGHQWAHPYEITPEIEAKIMELPGFGTRPKR